MYTVSTSLNSLPSWAKLTPGKPVPPLSDLIRAAQHFRDNHILKDPPPTTPRGEGGHTINRVLN